MRKPPGIPNELFTYERKKRHWTQGDVADKISAPDERLIRRWERGEVAPTPHYRGKLAEVFGKSARALGFPPDGQISFWHMSYRRNAYFTGREDILQLLRHTLLAQHASLVPRLPLALSGLGGVGKSQIALEYAYRYREHYHTVLWLHAASYQDLVADVTAVADLLDLPGKDTAKPAQLIETLKEWLTQLTRWLLIFDNVESLQLLDDFLPGEIKGHLLLTTLSHPTGTHAHRIAVEPMDNNTGAELLLRRAKLIAIDRTLEPMAAADAAIARSLSEDMGGLPLALDQAGAYIEETAVSLSEYEERYQAKRRDLLHRRGSWASDSEHPLPVAATLKLSFERACEQHPLASDILNFCAFLQPDAIPEELFQHDNNFKFGTTVFDEAIAALLRYSLIKRNQQENTLSMHRLVQAVLIDAMPPDLQKRWRERVVQALNDALPDEVEFNEWARCERLLPHALVCATWTDDELTPTMGVAELFKKAGFYLDERGNYSDAELLQVRVLSIAKNQLGDEHLHTARCMHNLAVLYKKQSKYSQAEPLYQQALAIQVKQLGAEHPETLLSLQNLAVLYMEQGRNGLAEPLVKRVLSIQEDHLGAEHPDTARSLFMLAFIWQAQGQNWQAEFLHRQALKILEKYLGTEHPDIAHPLYCLAFLLHEQGKHVQAEALHKRALSIQEQQFGAMHPHIQAIKMSYADFLHSIGYDADAEAAVLDANDEP
jgi:tetratricopeptide (TPR) repeat protein